MPVLLFEVYHSMRWVDLKQMPYTDALALQEKLAARARLHSDFEDALLLVEHVPAVITYGRRAQDENVVVSAEALEGMGVERHVVSRGGDVTWHGPGQLVVYCVRRLSGKAKSVHDHVERLEAGVIGLLERYGVEGHRREGMTGVWVEDAKCAALGVAVEHWVCYHGVALNVGRDLSGFDLIVPCGIKDYGVTSLSQLTGRELGVEDVKGEMVDAMADAFGTEARECELCELEEDA